MSFGIEPLESRIAPALAAVITPATTEIVTTLKDITNATQTTGSLRDAISQADNFGGPVYILFEVPVHGKEVPLKGTINLNPALGPLPSITSDISIEGSGIVINCGGKVQGLSIQESASLPSTNVSITGLTITNGNSYGGGITTGGDLSITGSVNVSLSNVKLLNGRAAGGGGLYIYDPGGTVTITGSLISGNHATGFAGASGNGGVAYGGGIDNLATTLIIQGNTRITKNTAAGGAGGAGGYYGSTGFGGGIFNTGALTVTSSTISGNTAAGGHGGKAINYSADPKTQTVINATGGGNGGYGIGGGIDNSYGTVTILKSVISGNAAIGGAGMGGGKAAPALNGRLGGTSAAYLGESGITVISYWDTVTADTVKPLKTTAPLYASQGGGYGGNGLNGGNGGHAIGGGISSFGPVTVSVSQSTISGNVAIAGHGGDGSAGGKGGNGGPAGVHNGIRYSEGNGGNGGNGGSGGNGGFAGGGGLYCNGSLTIQQSTLSGNSVVAGIAGQAGAAGGPGKGAVAGSAGMAGGHGTYYGGFGGGVDSAEGSIFLSEVTIAGNTALLGGGVCVYADSSAAIHNCTIAANTATSTAGGGLFIGLNANNDPVNVVSTIIAMNTGSNVEGILGAASSNNLIGGNPLLGPLAYHVAGTTLTTGATETMLPAVTSPAVVGGPGLNPDGLTADQNGYAFGSLVQIGAVQTVS